MINAKSFLVEKRSKQDMINKIAEQFNVNSCWLEYCKPRDRYPYLRGAESVVKSKNFPEQEGFEKNFHAQ
jgi:hypothetical protein